MFLELSADTVVDRCTFCREVRAQLLHGAQLLSRDSKLVAQQSIRLQVSELKTLGTRELLKT